MHLPKRELIELIKTEKLWDKYHLDNWDKIVYNIYVSSTEEFRLEIQD